VPTDRTRAGQLEQPRIDAGLVENVLALARQHAHVVSVIKVNDANRARLPADRLWQWVRLCGGRGRGGRRSGPWARRREVSKFVVVAAVFNPVRDIYGYGLCQCWLCG
jgi:hypothetical protein